MKIFYILFIFALVVETSIVVLGDRLQREAQEDPAPASGQTDPGNDDANPTVKPTVKTATTPPLTGKNNTSTGGFYNNVFQPNSDVVKRMLYVLLAVTGIVIVYFVFRAARLRSRRSKSKKYGVLTTPGADMEMAPLDQDDEDDDMTVFDVNNTK
ncbi:membrane protein FAM174-like [Saccoglossus kowalevskii]|uniref:Membrane protein FAM174-like n=1 Tax=Saccoglossus kowalevskii TaxID=10224 RepID=A0ABM0M220_SACKO|nr:PREDICTED: membrane protein FAM174-like [Saccoglossus kowalevskii]